MFSRTRNYVHEDLTDAIAKAVAIATSHADLLKQNPRELYCDFVRVVNNNKDVIAGWYLGTRII